MTHAGRSQRRLFTTLLRIAAILFVTEFAVMLFLPLFGIYEDAKIWEILVESLLLAILAFPVLYLVGFRPQAIIRAEDLRGYTRTEKRVLFLLLAYVAVALILVSVQGLLMAGQASGSLVMNLAGRQQMLSQYLAREALHWHEGHYDLQVDAADHLENVASKTALFDRVLAGLQHGDAELGLPPCHDPAARRELAEVDKAWATLRMTLPPAAELTDHADLAVLEHAADQVLAKMDSAVGRLQVYYEDRAATLYMMQGVFILAGGLIGLLLIVSFVQMISQRKRMEKELSQYRDHLEELVEDRTTELEAANQQLEGAVQSVKQLAAEAEQANKAKSEFLANMSHEIRTPMTAILGYADCILDEDVSQAERSNALQTIRRNGDHLMSIIDNILDLSKIEAGKLKVERIRCNPAKLLQEVKSLMAIRAEAEQLSFDCECVGPIPETIQSDPIRLRQVLINLIGNAIKFTEDGGVRVVTRLLDENTTVPKLQFSVIDSGIGMAEEQVVNLFQPFIQADSSTTRRFGGTGLGLTISKRLAQMLGGAITVKSMLGEGSEFTLTIQTGPLDGVSMLTGPNELGDSTAKAPEETMGAHPQARLGCRILLAEDSPDSRRLIAFVLERSGADVTTVENGRDAVDTVLAAMFGKRESDPPAPFDLILMDMQMPVMDGYEATRLLRKRGYTGPIIALTAHAMDGDREKCIQAGCDEYATKPIDQQCLVATVLEVLNRPELAAV